MFVVRRSEHNPILMPNPKDLWEAEAVFNWSAVQDGDTTHVTYRAMALPELLGEHKISLSTIGHAISNDGEHYRERKQLIVPENDWEKFGCEDPRITKFEDTYYIFYTALSMYPFKPEGIRVAVAKTRDFKTIDEKHLVTPFNSKAFTLFPERINGKMAALVTVNPDRAPEPSQLGYAEFESEEDIWSEEFWNNWYASLPQHVLPVRRDKNDQVEIGASPLLTDDGWLMVYSHMQHYFEGKPIFGIEAMLLNKDNPREIIGRTHGPMLIPETLYEKNGNVMNVTFPSGALIHGKTLDIYYGSADTTCCLAHVNLNHLLTAIIPTKTDKLVKRFEGNPIITPREDQEWEEAGTFNPAAIDLDGTVYILYRAQSKDGVSTIGMATSKNGLSIDERLSEPIYVPREEYEKKGCEDARIVEIGERLYMFYTAYDGQSAPRVAVTSIAKSDFLGREWNWAQSELITPPGIMDKDAAVLPEKIGDEYLLIHRISDVLCVDKLKTLNFAEEKIARCFQLMRPRPGMWDGLKIGISSPPMKTDKGWLMLYHGVSEHTVYRVGAALLDLEDPTTVVARTTVPLLEPEELYELEGQVPNVVFPCGSIIRDDTLYIYYGGGDSVVGVATMCVSSLLSILLDDAE